MRKSLFLLFILFICIDVYASGNISVSKSNITLNKNNSSSISVNASNVAGKVEIVSLDTSIAVVDKSSYFFDTSLSNSTTEIKVTGKKAGTTTIRIILKDIATFDGEELSGHRDIQVVVKEVESVNKQSSSSKTDTKSGTKTETKANNNNNNTTVTNNENDKKEINITRLEIVGYNIDFNKDILEYHINVKKELSELYVIVEGSNFAVTGDKVVNIENKDYITISLSNDNEIKEYKIYLDREETNCDENESENKTANSIILYSMIFFEGLSLLLMFILIRNKLKNK